MSELPLKPKGFNNVTAYLRLNDSAAAIDYYTKIFGAKELYRLAEPSGKIVHAELTIGDTLFMIADEYPDMGILGPLSVGNTTVAMHVFVQDVDATIAKAVETGASVLIAPSDQFYGQRAGRIVDPFGHQWLIATVIEEVSNEEIVRRFNAMF